MFVTTETQAFNKDFWIKLKNDFLKEKGARFFCAVSESFANLWERDNTFKCEVRGLAQLWTSSVGEFSPRVVGHMILFRLWVIDKKNLKSRHDSDESRNLRLNFLEWVIDYLTKNKF